MDENILRFRVGIFVVIAMCILGILIFVFSDVWDRQHVVYMYPTKAPGVKKNTPIRKYGILIGRVHSVTPRDGFVELGLGINDKEKIYQNEMVSIGSESILGDAGIEILPLSKEERGAEVTEGGELKRFEIRDDPFSMIVDMQPKIIEIIDVLKDTGESVTETSNKVGKLTTNLDNLFQDDQGQLSTALSEFRETNRLAQGALENFTAIFEDVNEIVGDRDLKSQIKQALFEILPIFIEIKETIARTKLTIDQFGTIPEGVNKSIANIEEITTKLNDPEVLSQIQSSIENANALFVRAKEFATKLNELDFQNGTVGKLLNDTEIHDAILESARNVESTTAKLEPLINDLRMFADAIARNPGAIVKGAIRRGGDGNYKGTAGRDGGLYK